VGKVLLAGLSQAAVEQLIGSVELERFTEHTLVDKKQLYRVLDLIRDCGYGTDEEEYTVGVRCVAVPLRADGGQVVAAMSVSAPAIRFDAKGAERALALLKEASEEISQALGYRAASISLA
jgi:IclR family KDG regulon transcriptional repressor